MMIKLMITSIILFASMILHAETSDTDKIRILTEYLVQEKSVEVDTKLSHAKAGSPEYKRLSQEKEKIIIRARNEAIATVYGKPIFKTLVYDDSSEMFFGRIVSENGNFTKDVNFYMPKKRARAFKKDLEAGRIEIEHAFDDNEIVFKEIELSYKGVNYPIHVDIANTFTLKLGGYFVGQQDTEITARRNGVGGVLNLKELFGMEEKTNAIRVSAIYKLNPKHSFELSWYSLKSSGEKSVNREFSFNGETYGAGAFVNIYSNVDVYKLNYVYSAYHTNKLELAFRAGLHITSIETGLSAGYNLGDFNESVESGSVSITAPLPVFGLSLGYEIIPKLNVNYTIDYFAFSYDSTVSGVMSDSILSLDYRFSDYVGVGAGLNRNQMQLKGKSESTDFELRTNITGLLGYLIFSY